VSHYLKEGTALDKDAYKRSTSVYLVGTVLPMLPEKLSNNLCSLRPDEDKLTFSALFSVDEEGRIKKTWFGKTIIHSKRRFTYEEAQEVIESGQGDFAEELKKLDLFVEHLRKERMTSGGIAFETDEVQFETNEQGWPIRIFRKQRKNAHLLVEDLMLLANRSVASHMAELSKGKPVPFVYRIHDTPDPEKLERFSHYAKHFGYNFDFSTPSRTAVSMNKIMGSVSGNESLRILQPLAIRCMAKAEYSIHNIGHYGLAFKHYTHFTSPIRRYSDVLVHRLLEKNLHAVFRTEMSDLESKCKHISQQERKALDAERESIKLKQVQYLSELIGEVFKGMISGIVNFGIFVELPENGCEGLVRFDKLGEPFELDDQNFTARGLHTGKLFRLGDMVQVQVIGTHQERREIDFKIL
jgi:ribonuclease R